MSVAVLCKYYGWTLSDVRELTLKQFSIFMKELGKILKMENGSDGESEKLTKEKMINQARFDPAIRKKKESK